MSVSDGVYCIDTSSVLEAWRRRYRPKNFGSFWNNLDELIAQERVLMSREVFTELQKKDDDVHKWFKSRTSNKFIIEIDDDTHDEVRRIMGLYPRLVDTAKGRSEADPFVIALARVRKATVVSEEQAGSATKPKIPDVCKAQGLKCLPLADMIEELDWSF